MHPQGGGGITVRNRTPGAGAGIIFITSSPNDPGWGRRNDPPLPPFLLLLLLLLLLGPISNIYVLYCFETILVCVWNTLEGSRVASDLS